MQLLIAVVFEHRSRGSAFFLLPTCQRVFHRHRRTVANVAVRIVLLHWINTETQRGECHLNKSYMVASVDRGAPI